MSALRVHALSLLVIFGSGVSAAPAPAKSKPAPSPSALMSLLQRTMMGQPVVAVDDGGSRYGLSEPDSLQTPSDAVKPGASLLHRLQAICGPMSVPERSHQAAALIPFEVAGTWVIAPETREDLVTDFSSLTPLTAADRGLVLDEALNMMTSADAQALGSTEGLRVDTLPDAIRVRIEAALRPPMDVAVFGPPTDPSKPYPTPHIKHLPTITEPLDWSAVRLRAALRDPFPSAQTPAGRLDLMDREQMMRGPTSIKLFPVQREIPFQVRDLSGVSIDAYTDVPNRFRPGDLDGRGLSQPVGLEGVHSVQETLARLSLVTGLRLTADPLYLKLPVFIGRKSMSCGAVLDGLRLSLTASWRKMGGTYLLAWDRRGIRGVQQIFADGTRALAKDVIKREADRTEGNGNQILARTLPFASGEPFALTVEQRRQLAARPAASDGEVEVSIPFQELTQDQQAAFRARAAHNEVLSVSGGPPGSNHAPSEEDIQASSLQCAFQVELSVEVPGIGNAVPNFTYGFVTLDSQNKGPSNVSDPHSVLPKELQDPKPWTAGSKTRGIIVPILRPARIAELAREMARRGLNVLYYPVLYGGNATFPNATFPLSPALHGADGWAAAVAATKSLHIHLTGYVQTLAWQSAGDNAHWLRQHRDWIDTDALGRTRLQWADNQHVTTVNGSKGAVPLSNYVRPSEPAVAAKLDAFIKEFSAKESDGVAFTEWAPLSTPISDDSTGRPVRQEVPTLGYAMPDRLAAVHANGTDPVDVCDRNLSPLPLAIQRLIPAEYEDDPRQPVPDPHLVLLAHLVETVHHARKGWKATVVDEASGLDLFPQDAKPEEKVAADVVLAGSDVENATATAFLVPVPPRSSWAGLEFPEAARSLMDQFSAIQIAAYEVDLLSHPSEAVVYDFRQAPDEITDSLRWLTPPTAPPTQSPR